MAKKLLSNLANAKTRTLVIIAGAVLIIGILIVIISLSGPDPIKNRKTATSKVPKNVESIPGSKVTEKYRKLQVEENIQRTKKAKKEGSSAIATLIGGEEQTEKGPEAIRKEFLESVTQSKQKETDKLKQLTTPKKPVSELDKLLAQQQAELEATQKLEQERLSQEETARRLQARQKQISELSGNMETQAKAALSSWGSVTPQAFVQGTWANDQTENQPSQDNEANTPTDSQTPDAISQSVLVKAGTILFASLDTAVNSDEPSPVMATIVQGKYKGAKVIGNMQATTDDSSSTNAERIVLNFSTMNILDRPESVTISAVAIDPMTARTALATDVDHHYLLRYGSLFASAFLEGYGQAVASAGTTVTAASDGSSTTTTRQALSGKQELYASLGEMGTKWGEAISDKINRPTTIKVDAGTGIGILFLGDLKTE